MLFRSKAKNVGKKKALIAAKAVQKGVNTVSHKKIRTSVHFHRPKTLRLKRAPKYSRQSAPGRNKLDYHQILRHPLTNESAMKKIEENNTLVFIVDLRANKFQIKDAIKKMYQVTPSRVNTLVRPNGQKKAYVKIPKDVEAVDIANKIGII